MNWVKVTALALVVLVLAQLNRWSVLDKLFFMLLGLLLLSYLWSRLSLRGLVLTRQTLSDRAQVGDILIERLRVENQSRFSKLWVEVLDQSTLPGHHVSRVIRLGPHDVANWKVQTWCARRGRFRLGPMTLASGDPFGLFAVRKVVPYEHELIVYPATVDLTGFRLPFGESTGGNALQRRTPFVTPNAAGVRDYAPGDSFNRIAWSVTARTGRLMVKEFELDPSADLWLIVDGDRRYHVRAPAHDDLPPAVSGTSNGRLPLGYWLDSTEEYAVTVAASLARHFLNQNHAVGMVLNTREPVVVPADRGARQLVKILEYLAVLQADGIRGLDRVLVEELGLINRRSILAVITPSPDEAWVRALVDLAERQIRSIAVVIEPSTFTSGKPQTLAPVASLAALGIPTILIKYGDDIARALTSPAWATTAATSSWS